MWLNFDICSPLTDLITRTTRSRTSNARGAQLARAIHAKVTLSDCFRILSPGARDEHMKEMKSWLQDHERMRHRVPPKENEI